MDLWGVVLGLVTDGALVGVGVVSCPDIFVERGVTKCGIVALCGVLVLATPPLLAVLALLTPPLGSIMTVPKRPESRKTIPITAASVLITLMAPPMGASVPLLGRSGVTGAGGRAAETVRGARAGSATGSVNERGSLGCGKA